MYTGGQDQIIIFVERHLLSRFCADAEEGGARLGDDDDDAVEDDEDLAGQEYGFVMFDPVWGKPDYPRGHHITACQARLFAV